MKSFVCHCRDCIPYRTKTLHAACSRNFKEILRHRLCATCGWPEVLSMSPIVQTLSSSLCPYHVYLK
jgi:hypothetical protein